MKKTLPQRQFSTKEFFYRVHTMSGNSTSCLWYEICTHAVRRWYESIDVFSIYTILSLRDYDRFSRMKGSSEQQRKLSVENNEKFARDRYIIGMRDTRCALQYFVASSFSFLQRSADFTWGFVKIRFSGNFNCKDRIRN